MKDVHRAAIAALAAWPYAAAFASDPQFRGIGFLQPGAPIASSMASGVSGDGLVVVGASAVIDPGLGLPELHATRWTRTGGLEDLGLSPGTGLPGTTAGRASADGSVIAGASGFVIGSGFEVRNGLYWRSRGSAFLAQDIIGSYTAVDVSADGSTIVGALRVPGPLPVADQAYLYTESGGIQRLGQIAGTSGSQARAVFADGQTVAVAGFSFGSDALTAWRWTAAGGMQELAGRPKGVPAEIEAISSDGSTLVGSFNSQAAYWNEAELFVPLGTLPVPGSTRALDVSGDGSIIVGTNFVDVGQQFAFIWDATRGIRDLRMALEAEYGILLPGWTLQSANGISDDGLTIVGTGINPGGVQEGWVVHVPAPSAIAIGMIAAIGGIRRRRA